MHLYKYGNKFWFYLLMVLALMSSFSGVFTAYVTGRFINVATRGSFNELGNNILVAFFGIFAFFVLEMIFVFVKNELIYTANVALKSKAFSDVFNHVIGRSSEEISLLTNDLKLIETNAFKSEVDILQYFFVFLFSLSYAFYLDVLTTITFIIGTLAPLVVGRFFSKSIKNNSEKWSAANSSYIGKLQDYIKGKASLINYGAVPVAKKGFDNSSQNLEKSLRSMSDIGDSANATATVVANLCMITLSFGFGIYQVIQHHLSLGGFIAIVQVSNSILNPIFSIAGSRNRLKTTESIFKKIEGVHRNQGSDHVITVQEILLKDGGIAVQGKKLFAGLNLKVKKGQKVLIMAPSGFGKTQLLYALSGFRKFSTGQYLVNNQEQSPKTLQTAFAFIKQNPFIFDESIRFNITMGQEYSDEEVQAAITGSALDDLISEKGLNYVVGEDGKNLSGGQLQRIEIARGLITNRSFILADEITSALDNLTAEKVYQKMFESDKTLIEVSHKVSKEELARYDQVIHLDELTSLDS